MRTMDECLVVLKSVLDVPDKFYNAYLEGLQQIRRRGWLMDDIYTRCSKIHRHDWFWDWVDGESNGAREYARETAISINGYKRPKRKPYRPKKIGIPYFSESFLSMRRF